MRRAGVHPNDLIEVDTTPVEGPIAPPRSVADLSQASVPLGAG
ncbi:hypothetical protein [Streptomyces sp. MS06]